MNAVAISPSRPFRAATVADDNQLVFYHGPPFRFNSASRSHSKFVYDVAFSPDGKSLVSVGADAKVFLYDGKSGESKGALSVDGGHKGRIFAVGWDKSSAKLVTASADQTIKLWDVEASKVVQYLSLFPWHCRLISQNVVLWLKLICSSSTSRNSFHLLLRCSNRLVVSIGHTELPRPFVSESNPKSRRPSETSHFVMRYRFEVCPYRKL